MILRILMIVLGMALFALELKLEIDGVLGFLLATLGVFLIIISLTIKGLVKLFVDFLL